jgi:hypothetical protein
MSDNGYVNAPATKMLATNCGICGRPLVDALSVQRGIGPECYEHVENNFVNIPENVRKQANELIHKAAIVAQNGEIVAVQAIADQIRALGLDKLADKVGKRFRNADRYAEIVISIEGDDYRVETPFRRGAKEEFIAAWRNIPGRRFHNAANYVPVVQKQALFKLLKRFFGGKFAKGPKGLFRIPEPDFEPEQGELPLQKAG